MARPDLDLELLPERYAVCRLGPEDALPAWATARALSSITRTRDELSIVCRETDVPVDVTAARGFRALKLVGPFDFSLVGILVSVAAPLADAGISLFAVSTYDTDYVLVREEKLGEALETLGLAGHRVAT